MGQTVADVALLDAAINCEQPVKRASLKGVRLGVVRDYFFRNLDADTTAVTERALTRLKKAGATIVEVEMPGLTGINAAVGFPIAIYEAYDDLADYLRRYVPGTTVEDITAKIASADVKGTYAGLVVPRKLSGPNNTLVDAKPIYDAAISTNRPKLIKLYADTFSANKLDALIFPTTPAIAPVQGPEASSFQNLLLYIQNTDPGSNAGIPGLSSPAGIGAAGLPVGIEIDGPAGSDRHLLSIGMAIENALGRLPVPKY